MATWGGIGNFSPANLGGPLVQEGTSADWPTLSTDQAWWEDWPANDPVAQSFFATPGQQFLRGYLGQLR